MTNVVPVTDPRGAVINAELLAAAESVHRQLRPQLPPAYVERMKEIFAGGAEMAVCLVGGKVAGITVFRVLEKTFTGRELYCDDLVTDETKRSTGIGHALIEYMEGVVRERKCDAFTLDSGTQREQAHKFYFREGMTITSFHFTMRRSGARR
jgi:GNAT superfamily N-acetyltransferase